MKRLLLLSALLNFAVANDVFSMETRTDKSYERSQSTSGELTADQIQKLKDAGAVEIVVSPTIPDGEIILCPVFHGNFSISDIDPISGEEIDGKRVQIFTIATVLDCMRKGKRSVIWVKSVKTDEKNYFIIDGESPKFVGSLEVAKQVYPMFSEGDRLNGRKINRLESACKNAISYTFFELGFGISDTDLNDMWGDPVVQAILADNIEEFQQLASVAGFNPDMRIGNCCSLMQFMALCGAVRCFKYGYLNKWHMDESIAPFVVAGGNFEIIHLVDPAVAFNNTINEHTVNLVNSEIGDWLCMQYEQWGADLVAYKSNRFDIVKSFFRYKDEIENDKTKYYSILHSVIQDGHLNIVKYLIEECHAAVEVKDREGKTPLLLASEKGYFDIVKYLIEGCHANIEAKDRDGNTPLLLASEKGYFDIVKYLIEECHANVEVKDWDDKTPLLVASEKGYFDIVKYLIEECHANVEVKDRDGKTPLHGASLRLHLDIVKYLIEKCHANIEAKDCNGWTPLHWGAMLNDFEFIKYLVEECHANVEAKDNAGRTPIDLAIDGEIKVYLSNSRFQNGDIFAAIQNGNLENVRYCAEIIHSNIEAKDNEDRTPLLVASELGSLDIVKYLIEECHANIEAKNKNGETPLFVASDKGHLDVVKYLVEECHCNVETKDNYGNTLVEVAGSREVADYLRSKK